MSKLTDVNLAPEVEYALIDVGRMLKRARLASGETEEQIAGRLNVSRGTWRRIEKGDPNVRVGTFMQALVIYELKERVMALGNEDELTALLLDHGLPMRATRSRAPRSA